MATATVSHVEVIDIANPGRGPIFAVQATADRRYVLTDPKALTDDEAFADRLAAKVLAKGVIETDLWDVVDRTWAEVEDHFASLYEWEEIEKQAGRW